eukprot:GHUV01033893.1.p1 GENE.GHUV01033893.1~~GHUV01033893.1.p1  ORF type:complete len:108 (-),score=15.23 GHUV01033893.1:792-1115(-)
MSWYVSPHAASLCWHWLKQEQVVGRLLGDVSPYSSAHNTVLFAICMCCCLVGDDVPKGRDAVGWHIAVYWKDDRTFYEGEIIDFENSAGRHKVGFTYGYELHKHKVL